MKNGNIGNHSAKNEAAKAEGEQESNQYSVPLEKMEKKKKKGQKSIRVARNYSQNQWKMATSAGGKAVKSKRQYDQPERFCQSKL